MNKVLKYFKEHATTPLIKQIHVYGWQFEYDHLLVGAVSKYLFEELDIVENIAPLTNENREGRIMDKHYITIHDTGDSASEHTAKFWSDAVYSERIGENRYACSFQYVVGNDGVYHNIPDNEVAWHAGDGTKFEYRLYDTNVKGTNPNPVVTISDDGYYMVDGEKSVIAAPRIYKEKNGEVLVDRLAKTSDINSQSVEVVNTNGKYYIGETYFSQGYMLIANRGGNNNSIGIESCINEETDIHYTWQKTAKLTAYLMHKFNIALNNIKQHHFFSGKNCPQTMRMNGLWDYFLSLVQFEYDMQTFIDEGYQIKLVPLCDNIDDNGRIRLTDGEQKLKYKIVTTINNETEEWENEIIIPRR